MRSTAARRALLQTEVLDGAEEELRGVDRVAAEGAPAVAALRGGELGGDLGQDVGQLLELAGVVGEGLGEGVEALGEVLDGARGVLGVHHGDAGLELGAGMHAHGRHPASRA